MTSIIVLTGPTAVGKTELSLALARRLDAEIISADSRQIYVGLDIGTAKPSPEQLSEIRHHFIDELEIDASYSAGRFERDANDRIGQILDRGRVPIVTGGSTLYVDALRHGLAAIPDVSEDVINEVEEELTHRGGEALFQELANVDPRSAARMDSTKTHRLVRALAVYRSTKSPLSAFHEKQEPPPYQFRTFVLSRERSELYQRINQRVDEMLSRGLIEEVRSILVRGCDPNANPLRTIGYRETYRFLSGEIPGDEMVRLVKRNTRRYAKRQLTWFRRHNDNIWLDASQSCEHLIDAVLAQQ